jgi:(2Fe-2S) ferredoxin
MATTRNSPYVCHIFVCTNDRGGKAKACADGQSPVVRSAMKEEIKERGWKGRVRVSKSGCMGLCQDGPNVIVYPQKIWFSGVSPDDLSQVFSSIEEIVETAE